MSSEEDLLNAYQSLIQLDTVESKAALKLIKVYVDVIAENPDRPEFRTICIQDANFCTTVWQLEEAFLRAAGFEEQGEKLILPGQVDIGAIKDLFEKRNKDKETQEVCQILEKDLQSIGLIDASHVDFVKENKKRSKEILGMMMRAYFRKKVKSRDDKSTKFQPCQDEIDFLRSTPKGVALCHDLRRASLKSFYKILYPEEGLGERDSIFHLHKVEVKNDKTELDDQNKRARALARVVKDARGKVTIYLLDGHGRMLVCILRALDKESALEQVDRIRLFEISEVVHNYHKLATPSRIEKLHHTVIDHRQIPRSGVIYLNFCSIPSMAKCGWTDHFKKQTIEDWVYGCCKENVLKYIWKAVNPPYSCTVMVSCIIKHSAGDGIYFQKHKQHKSVNGLGFLYLLRRRDLFDAKIISIRPKSEIMWKTSSRKKCLRRCPIKLRSGRKGNPFVTLMVKPHKGDKTKLSKIFKEEDVMNLKEEQLQKNSRIGVKFGQNLVKYRLIKSRTELEVKVEVDGEMYTIHIDKIGNDNITTKIALKPKN